MKRVEVYQTSTGVFEKDFERALAHEIVKHINLGEELHKLSFIQCLNIVKKRKLLIELLQQTPME